MPAALTTMLLHWLPLAHGAVPAPNEAAITLATPTFSISINSDTCLATATYSGGGGGAPLTSTPVPFVSFYNRVSDAREENLAGCVSVARTDSSTLRVTAAHGAGSVDISVSTHPEHLLFTVKNISGWTGADPVEKHLAMGEFWTGMDGMDNTTSPPVMGKLQGPFGTPGSNVTTAAGFMSIGNTTYYRYIFYATPGQKLAFAFCPTLQVANTWIAVGKSQGLQMMNNPNRHKTWWWSAWTEATRESYAARAKKLGIDILVNTGNWHSASEELTISKTAFPSGINDTAQYFAGQGLDVGLHMHPDIVWPCVGSEGLACLGTGIGISPMYQQCPECMVPEGLAPTFRSGTPPPLTASAGQQLESSAQDTTEDLGFWWGHDKHGDSALMGNPKPCGQGTCNAGDWAALWGANMSLFNHHWSKLGVYRSGGAIGFGGTGSHGVVPHYDELSSARAELTLGLTLHKATDASAGDRECIATKAGVFSLCLVQGKPTWAVNTQGAGWCNATSTLAVSAFASSALTHSYPGEPTSSGVDSEVAMLVIKATYNSSSGAKLFVNGKIVGTNACQGGGDLTSSTSDLLFGAESAGIIQRDEPDSVRHHVVRDELAGAIEEIFLKNASAENRNAYLFADDNRKMGTFLIDLSRAPGRKLFASAINNVLNEFNPAAVQYDGFEKLQLIAGQDFGHSSKTFDSGLWRGNPTPDWYHYEGWPLRWGIGILQGIEAAHSGMNSNTAVECSFMAPGLGPWRPDMAPYVDEHPGLVKLGLEWHSKMLLRIEIAGTIINSYDTYMARYEEDGTFGLGYFVAGVVTGGLAFQPAGSLNSATDLDPLVGRWMARYKRFGHAMEDGVRTLVYDAACCHIQGVCEWTACQDTVVSRLSGGRVAGAAGLYIGSRNMSTAIAVPDSHLSNNGALLVFLAYGINNAAIDYGSSADTRMTVVPTAPTNSTAAARSLTLSGGWWDLKGGGCDVQLTTRHENGTVLRTTQLFGKSTSGQQKYELQIDADAAEAGSLHYEFEKLKKTSQL